MRLEDFNRTNPDYALENARDVDFSGRTYEELKVALRSQFQAVSRGDSDLVAIHFGDNASITPDMKDRAMHDVLKELHRETMFFAARPAGETHTENQPWHLHLSRIEYQDEIALVALDGAITTNCVHEGVGTEFISLKNLQEGFSLDRDDDFNIKPEECSVGNLLDAHIISPQAIYQAEKGAIVIFNDARIIHRAPLTDDQNRRFTIGSSHDFTIDLLKPLPAGVFEMLRTVDPATLTLAPLSPQLSERLQQNVAKPGS